MSACSELAGDPSDRNMGISRSVLSPPPIFSPSSPSRRTMEDAWRDISLSFLRDRDPVSIPTAILQDFMSGPFQRNPPFTGVRDHSSRAAEAVVLLDSPVTCLSLSSGNPEATRPGPDLYKDTSLDMISYCGKRGPDTRVEPCDRTHKRLIKNRESAARSRARQQAYTTELEMEFERLKQENVELRRQQEKFLPTAPACDRIPRKNSLRRTLTSPF